MSGVNKCTFLGNVGKADVREDKNGGSVLSFSLAVNEVWFDSNTKEKRERVEWIPCTMFGKRAQSVGQYVTKGKQVYVEGRWQTRKWQDKEGRDRYSTECIVNDLQLLGGGNGKGRRDSDAGSDFESGSSNSDFGDIPF